MAISMLNMVCIQMITLRRAGVPNYREFIKFEFWNESLAFLRFLVVEEKSLIIYLVNPYESHQMIWRDLRGISSSVELSLVILR